MRLLGLKICWLSWLAGYFFGRGEAFGGGPGRASEGLLGASRVNNCPELRCGKVGHRPCDHKWGFNLPTNEGVPTNTFHAASQALGAAFD